MTDHERGCQGREYTCTCGYDDKQRALIETLTAALDEAADFIQPFNRADELLEKIEAALAAAKEQSA